MRIVISEDVDPQAVELLEEHAEVVFDPGVHADHERLQRALAGADALIVRNATRVDADLLALAPRLRVVGRVGVGLDNLHVPALRERGIVVTWAPGTNAVSVAEYVLGCMFELSRSFRAASAGVHAGRWDRRGAVGTELHGKTLGIVGLGDIGSRLARRAVALGLGVIAADPMIHESSYPVQELGVRLVGLDELLEAADVVSLHVPLVDGTRDLMSAARIARMKRGAVLINTARGGLVDEEALADAIATGRLAGAALDVRRREPPGDADPLAGLENVILTPHIAGVTHESLRRASLHVARDVLRALRGERPVSLLE